MARDTFSSLPLELRINIWALTLPTRTIPIKFTPDYYPNGTAPSPYMYGTTDLAQQGLPTPFHVSQQSRTDMQAFYRPLISSIYETAPGELVNLNVDAISCTGGTSKWYSKDKYHDAWQRENMENIYEKYSPLSLLALDKGFCIFRDVPHTGRI